MNIKKERPEGWGERRNTIKTKGVMVYKDLNSDDQPQQSNPYIGKEVVRAYESLMGKRGRLEEIFRGERDFTTEPGTLIDRFWRKYTKQFEYPDGWRVGVMMLPDDSVQNGAGYHKISVVASTIESNKGIAEAMRRAAKVKTKLEIEGRQITKETVVVLSANIPFIEAKKHNGPNYSGSKTVMVFSVKNALGVVKVVLNKLANFFTARAKGILQLPNLKEGATKELAYLFLKRAEHLGRHVEQLKQALVHGSMGAKRRLQKLIGQSYALINMAKKTSIRWGKGKGKLWVYDDDLAEPGYVRDKINWAADFQGIELYGDEAKEKMRILTKAKSVS